MAREFNASNRPRTCLWCGRRLYSRDSARTLERRIQNEIRLYGATGERAAEIEQRMRANHQMYGKVYGIMDMFDTGACAQMFGLRAAFLGYRLKSKLPKCIYCGETIDFDLPADHHGGDEYACKSCQHKLAER